MIGVAQVKAEVAREFKVPIETLEGRSRLRDHVVPRQIAFYYCRTHTNASLPRIGHRFGGRDHSTVAEGIVQIVKKLAKDPDLRDQFKAIGARLDMAAAE